MYEIEKESLIQKTGAAATAAAAGVVGVASGIAVGFCAGLSSFIIGAVTITMGSLVAGMMMICSPVVLGCGLATLTYQHLRTKIE